MGYGNRLSVREKMLRAWERCKVRKTVPSLDYDDLCRWYEDDDGQLDCTNCPLKDCESIDSMWVRRDYDAILHAIALWLSKKEVRQFTLDMLRGINHVEFKYITYKDLTDAVLALGGPSHKGWVIDAYISALEEWKV